MKLKLISILFISFFIVGKLTAQNYTFKVIGSKGNIVADGKAIKIGTTLTENQNLTLAKDAFLSLLHSNGKPLELKTEGSFKVKDLASKVEGSVSISSKYIDYVEEELTKSGGPNAEKERKTHMKKTGSVERSLPQEVFVLSQNTEEPKYIFGNIIALKFYLKSDFQSNFALEKKDFKAFKIIIKNMADEILYEKETVSNMDIIELDKGKLASENDLVFKVVAIKKDNAVMDKDSDLMFSKLDTNKQKQLSAELANVIDIKAEPTALSKLIEARFFEENGFFLDAVTAYEKALELSNNTESYREMYKCFLIRNDFRNDVEEVLFGKNDK